MNQSCPAATFSPRSRGLAVLTSAVLALAVLVAVPAAPAAAAADSFSITPDSGAPVGGTEVTVTPPGVRFTSVSGGYYHSLAVGSDGKVYAWGENLAGQLGDGTTTSQPTPVQVLLPSDVTITSVSAGYYHSVAVGANGKTYSWGANFLAQLGNGDDSGESQSVPAEVVLPSGVTFTSVSAGGDHTLARGSDGRVYGWGLNLYGQLGDGTTTNRVEPVEVPLPSSVTFTSVAAGYRHSLAVGSDGKTYGWGFNHYGQFVQAPDTFTCTTSGTSCLLTGLAPGVVTASVVATTVTGDSTPATGTGTVLAIEDAPPSVPADQGGVTIEVQNTAGDVVTEAAPGQALTVIVGGFAPNSLVHVFFYSTPELLASGLTNALGEASFPITVPSGASLGNHTLVASGLNSTGATASASVLVGVAAGGLGGTGGGDASGLLTLGILLLLAGAVLVFAVRRRGAQAAVSSA